MTVDMEATLLYLLVNTALTRFSFETEMSRSVVAVSTISAGPDPTTHMVGLQRFSCGSSKAAQPSILARARTRTHRQQKELSNR
jgi:hypothetical protein